MSVIFMNNKLLLLAQIDGNRKIIKLIKTAFVLEETRKRLRY